jgi:hypothetical protein
LTALSGVNVEFAGNRVVCSTLSSLREDNVTRIARNPPDVTFASLSEASVTSALRVTFAARDERPRGPETPAGRRG